MTDDEAVVFATLAGALVLFMAGKPRYDAVAVLALLTVVIAGVVDASTAFRGFGHPAVITVAAVLVISRGLERSGVVDLIAGWLEHAGSRPGLQVPAITGAAIPASAFMNNVGALALLMPAAIKIARKAGNPPSLLLMPLAFASLLGGLITLIGTPPNIIIATFRAENSGDAFRMFDFTPVGLGVAAAGGLFIALVGWRLIPVRKGQADADDLFRVEDYLTEVRVPEGSKVAGMRVRDIGEETGGNVLIVSVVRNQLPSPAPSPFEVIRERDLLIVEADSDSIAALVDEFGLELGEKASDQALLGSNEVTVAEVVVGPRSLMIDRTPIGLNLRWRFGINILAVARQGERLAPRLKSVRFQTGDVLLIQARKGSLADSLSVLGCLPLAERDLKIGQPRRLALSLLIFAAAIGLAAFGVIDVQIAFVAAAVAMVISRILSVGDVYESIDWPVIVLLGAMIPVGDSLAATGGAERLAGWMIDPIDGLSAIVAITLLLIVAMLLSDVVNNAAAAVVLAPVGISLAAGMDASADPFLMAVAVGASSAFLTPIGHQSNTLVMGPGGYRFSDYWRMGLPLEVVIVAVSVPLIVLVWPP